MKYFCLILASLTILQAFGSSCENPLLTQYNFTPLPNPENVQDLQYCPSLKKTSTCCAVESINSLQTKTNQLLTTLENIYVSNDQSLIAFSRSLNKLKRVVEQHIGTSQNDLAILTRRNNVDAKEFDKVSKMLKFYETTGARMTWFYKNFEAEFQSYQDSRSLCISKLVQFQADLWCMSCHPDFSSKVKVVNGEIKLSRLQQESILDSCQNFLPFLTPSNQLYRMNILGSELDNFVRALEKVFKGNERSIPTFNTLFAKVRNSPKFQQIPTDCENNKCDWVFKILYSNGMLNEDALLPGGLYEISRKETQDIKTQENVTGKNLRGTILEESMDFDEVESGVNVSFKDSLGDMNLDESDTETEPL